MRHVIGVILFLVFSAANADVVVNGDFEIGDYSGWTFVADAGADPAMVAGVSVFNGSNAFTVNPGTDNVGTEAGGTLSQTISLVGGTDYYVGADLMAIQDLVGPNVDGGTMTISINGDVLHIFDVGSIAGGATITDSYSGIYNVVATGDYALDIYFSRQYKNFSPVILHHIDDISVSMVPVPAAIWMFGSGLGLLGWIRRRKAV
jgi:hypothetical protein